MPREPDRLDQAIQFVTPLVLPVAASAATFYGVLAGTQAAGLALRVSSATPLLGTVCGAVGIAAASATAGQVMRRVRQAGLSKQARGESWRSVQGDPPDMRSWPRRAQVAMVGVRREDLLMDAAAGLLLWKALRGRWSSVMPSDLFRPGALQRTSVPASAVAAGRRGKDFAPKYSNHAQSKLLQLALEKDGCHHCGRTTGRVTADHIPPNVIAYGAGYKQRLGMEPGPLGNNLKRAMKVLGVSEPNKEVTELVALFDEGHRRLAAGVKRAKQPKSRFKPFSLLRRGVRWVRVKAGFKIGAPVQRLYPQCGVCSGKQAAAARAAKRTLVSHNFGLRRPKLHHAAGLLLPLRYMSASARGGSSGGRLTRGQAPPNDWWQGCGIGTPPIVPLGGRGSTLR
mmetsp:Transcript_337/g.969  ORF Transcript_337/g.969 Transcript_337/m.969 type:complete len:397 (-) Transcript_337:497-1687(-)